ncbi:MAG: hypothetical protein AAGH19_08810 [Pseudomonadota bacterium]
MQRKHTYRAMALASLISLLALQSETAEAAEQRYCHGNTLVRFELRLVPAPSGGGFYWSYRVSEYPNHPLCRAER